jgi:hypothetical protein
VTQPVRCLRQLGRTAERFPPSARLLVAVAIGLLWLGSAPALAFGLEPVKPPASPKPGLRPEPAPVAAAQAPPRSTAGSESTSTPATPPPPAVQPPASQATLVSSSRPAQPRTTRPSVVRAKPKLDPRPAPTKQVSKKADKPRAGQATTRVALGTPNPGSTGTNRLLFVGGLALLVLVLGDAAFLTLASRVVREPADRWR